MTSMTAQKLSKDNSRTGQFAAESEADAEDQSHGAYLPASVAKSLHDMRDRVGNASTPAV